MKLWPVLFWPKPKARQYTQHNNTNTNNRNINLQFETRTYSTPNAVATRTSTSFLSTFVISVLLLLITTTWGLTVTQQTTGNYEAVSANADGEVASAPTGLTNSYASPNYIKNYYQVGEPEIAKQQQQQQQQRPENDVVSAAMNLAYQEEVGEAGVIGRGFVGLQPNNYRNAILARGAAFGAGRGVEEEPFHAYDGGFMPTTFTTAGQHYAASLVGLQQTATDKINALHQYATTAANKNNLQANSQAYENVNSNMAEVDNNKAQHSLFRRLSNYGGLDNTSNGGAAGNSADSSGETTGTNLAIADDNGDGDGEAVGGTSTAEFMQNYALAYADNAEQSSLLQNFYNQQTPFNDGQSVPEQTFANYFPQSMAATAGYEIENQQQKYYTLNNYEQTTKPHQHQYEQQQYVQYPKQQTKPYGLQQQPKQQQQQQTFNKLNILTATPPPATYYQTYIQHKNDNKEQQPYQHQPQHRHVAADNYHRWKQNQITANYQPKQSAIEKQQHQQQQPQQHQPQQMHSNNQYHHLLQEPETAETSHSARFKKSPKHKSKRHDNPDAALHDHTYNYDTLLEQNDNTIEHETGDFAHVQIQQLEKLQEQLQLQQQQFIELQHQLIDHDQQLQIQKHIANSPPPALPPITHTIHHSPQSLQALTGAPLAKHTQIIRTIPIPQVQQVHVPYRENVTIEVPQPVIASIKKPFAIQIPVTKTVTIPKVQEVKIPIEKVRPFPVERPIPYIVERRVPYTVEKQIAQPVYYPVPIKVPILHTVIHKIHKAPQQQPSFNLPHTVYKKTHNRGRGHGHSHYYRK